MKVAFTPSALVADKYGNTFRISHRLKTYDWRVPGYLGAGFYSVDQITPEADSGRPWVMHEDDLKIQEEGAQ